MKAEGSSRIEAGPDTVWKALHDPAILRRAIPACRRVSGDAATGMDADLSHKLGPVTLRVTCRIGIEDTEPGRAMTLTARGTNLLARGAGVDMQFRLAAAGDATDVQYSGEAQLNGPLRRAAADLLDGAAEKLARAFLARLSVVIRQTPA